MKSVIAALLPALCLGITAPLHAAQERPSTEITLAEKDGLKAVVRIRDRASLADTDWLQIEITNNGPAARIKSAQLDAPSEHNGLSDSNDLAQVTLGVPAGRNPFSSVGNMIPAGVYPSSTPGVFAGAILGLPKEDTRYVMHLTLTLELDDGRSLKMSKPGVPLAFVWTRPNAAQIEDLQKQAVALLAKAIPSASALSTAEEAKLRLLLTTEETSRIVTLDQALAALKQRQLERSFRLSEVMALVYSRWRTDPAVIAFYREALQSRGPEAISELAAVSVWDNSFVEQIVELVEKRARSPVNSDVVSRGVEVLARNYPSWSGDPLIPPRLSKAVLEAHSALDNQSGTVGAFYNFVNLLVLTHNRAMIDYLRPYLNDKTIDRYTSLSANMPAGVTPMRYSELAANGISRLLGEPDMFDPWKRAKAPQNGPYPEWAEWDKQIAALQQRLAAIPKN